VADEFQKIVKAGATEYMLVNVSELRDYVMGARMIADICWDASAIYSQPGAANRYTAWWSREYFNPAAENVYNQYFSLLNRPDALWNAMNASQTLIDGLYKKVAGETPAPFDATQLKAAVNPLDEALAVEQKVESELPLTENTFFSIDAGLGLEIADKQTHAALKLAEALRAPDAASMWKSVFEARTYLEELETVFARGEYPPFERWYQESWIRNGRSANNPHRAHNELRAFIGSGGRVP
jgi:hypothetical protein